MSTDVTNPTSGKKSKATGITQKQFCEIFESSIRTAAESFKDKWSGLHPKDPVDIRFRVVRAQITDHPTIKAQATLLFELKRYGAWSVVSRTVADLDSVRALHNNEEDYLLKIWSDMFSEITQIGFTAVVNFLHAKEDNKQSVAQGNIQAIETEGV